MKSALQKSPIPRTHAFVAKVLKQPFFDPSWHFHSEYQLFMVTKGRGTQFIGDNIKPYKEGDITFTGPNLPHLWRSDNEGSSTDIHNSSEGIVVYFHESFIGQNLLEKEEGIKLRQLLKKSLSGVSIFGPTAEKVKKMLYHLLTLEGFDSVLELLKILNCLCQTNEIDLLTSPGYINSLKEGDTERMNKVYAHVMKHFKRKINISELAELTNMTTTSFSRYFRIHANKTFSEFVSEIRIGHACKLLIEQKMNASQACYASGFLTLSNFNRQFKAITKRTPLTYKKAYGMY
ncbi:MAG: AraC family transcriptional regulator [Flavobacteriaceae bacterium]